MQNDRPASWLLPMMTLGLMLGILIGRTADIWLPAGAGLAVSVLLAIGLRRRERCIALVLAAACAGCLMSFNAYHPAVPKEGRYAVTGIVTQEISLREDGQVQTRLSSVTLDGRPVVSPAYWTYYLAEGETVPEALRPGAYVALNARVYQPSGETTPGGFDFREYLLQRGMTFGLFGADDLAFPEAGRPISFTGLSAALRHELSARLMALMGPETGAYAAAMLLGERHFLPDEETAAFRDLGIAHILSVSGYHVGVLVFLLGWLLRPLHLHRTVRLALSAAVLIMYCLLTGGDAPVIRATLLYCLWEGARLMHVPRPPLHTLCAAMALQLIVSPPLLCSASFQLSYGAMLGLLLLQPLFLRGMTGRSDRFRRAAEPVSSSIAAQIGILPAQLYWFGEQPLLTLVANVLLLSVSSVVMALYWLTLAALPVPFVGTLIGQAASLATQGLRTAVRFLGSLAGTALWTPRANLFTLLGWAMLVLGLSVLLPRVRCRARRPLVIVGALLLCVSLIPLPHHGTVYMQFSVGEADAALLHDESTVTVIDTGADGKALAGHLHNNRLSVDHLILTHLHADHAGGVRALLDDGIPVRHCYLPAGARKGTDIDPAMPALLDELAAAGTQMHELSRGDVLTVPSGTLTCLWPDPSIPLPGSDANDGSMALLADLHGTTLLLTGDLTAPYEMYAALPADVLKAAHHGSRTGTTAEFLTAVDPQAVILSCGNTARREGLESRIGALPLYDTDSGGTVTVRIEKGRFTIETYLPTRQKETIP